MTRWHRLATLLAWPLGVTSADSDRALCVLTGVLIMAEFTKKDGEILIPIGDQDKFACVSDFKDVLYVHIRKFTDDKDKDDKLPTRKGIALTETEFNELLEKQDRLKQILHQLQKDKKKDHKKSRKRKNTD